MRPLDPNEVRYLALKWRELRIANRIQVIGAVVAVLVLLGGLGVAGLLGFKGGVANAITAVVVGLIFLGLLGLFGFIAVVRGREWSAAPPSFPMAVTIQGPFWEQTSARTMTRHGIGDAYVSAPPHWLPLLRRAGPSRVLTAEVVEGPAEVLILLSVNGVLSVSRDAERGLLLLRESLLPIFALLGMVGLLLTGLPAGVLSDADLTLWRYLRVGWRPPARFSSLAELQRARPPAFTRVELAEVILARGQRDRIIARDQPPVEIDQALRLSSEARRILAEIDGHPCAVRTVGCRVGALERHVDAMAVATGKLLSDAKAWVQRLDATPVPLRPGLYVRGGTDDPPDLRKIAGEIQGSIDRLGSDADRAKRRRQEVERLIEQLDRVMGDVPRGVDRAKLAQESARRFVGEKSEADLAKALEYADGTVAKTAEAVADRHTLRGILYRNARGGEWLAVGKSYSLWGLRAQAAALASGVVTLALILASVGVVARGRRLNRRLAAELPPSL